MNAQGLRRVGEQVGRWYSIPLLLLIWQLAVTAGLVESRLLPSVTRVLAALGEDLADGVLLYHTGVTLGRAAIGFGLAALAGVPFAAAMARSALVRNLFEPIFFFGYPIPKIALFPVFSYIFGLGSPSKIAFTFLECLYPIVVAAYLGFRAIPNRMIWTAENMGTPPGIILRRVILPAAFPGIFAGLRIALPISLIVVVLTEMIGDSKGLGYYLTISGTRFMFQNVYAAILVIGICGLVLDRALLMTLRRHFDARRTRANKPKIMDTNIREQLEKAARACRVLEMEGHGDMSLGHLSLREATGRGFWMKRNRIGLGEVLGPDDFILCDFDGKQLAGSGGRHSEWPIHSEIFRARTGGQCRRSLAPVPRLRVFRRDRAAVALYGRRRLLRDRAAPRGRRCAGHVEERRRGSCALARRRLGRSDGKPRRDVLRRHHRAGDLRRHLHREGLQGAPRRPCRGPQDQNADARGARPPARPGHDAGPLGAFLELLLPQARRADQEPGRARSHLPVRNEQQRDQQGIHRPAAAPPRG